MPSLLASAVEWFWRARALAEATAAKPDADQLARLAIAVDLREASESIGFASTTALAQKLVLGAAFGQLEALHPGEAPLLERDATLRRFEQKIVAGARRALTDEAPAVADTLALFAVVRGLVRDLRLLALGPRVLRRQRHLRVGTALAGVALLFTLLFVWPWWLRDKAGGATWQASSAFKSYPSSGRLGWTPDDAFFHTSEEVGPWLVIDLGRARRFHRVRVVNREIEPTRALPLELEVSVDRVVWRPAAERREPFDVWIAELPETEARYLRLRVPRKTFFHLRGVQVL
jgi:F5/8 type C domain